jgi:protein arginine N-methyltransferase 1
MPGQIVLQVAAAQSPACRALAEAWASEPVPAEFRWVQDYGVNSKHPRDFSEGELASAPAELGRIDLRADSPELLAFSTRLEIDRACALDGLAGWFACEIFDGVWMTNSPVAEDRITRMQVFLPFATPLSVEEGDSLEVAISVRHEVQLITWSARVTRTGQSARHSTWASKILDRKDRIPPAGRVPQLSRVGEARRTLLALIDGAATNAEIEQAMLRDHADLFPSAEQVARFVRRELNQSTR